MRPTPLFARRRSRSFSRPRRSTSPFLNQEIHLPDVEKPGNLIYLTYFNAGLRVYDIKDPLLPVETGWFIPPQPSARAGPLPRDLVTETEDVLVDTRGYIYVTDKQSGLWILRYTGPDQP